MPCYLCSSEYGILKKEVGCEACGFSFCSRCCKKREVQIKIGVTAKKIICNKCYECAANSCQSKPEKASPPLAHKKRMAALKKKSFSVDSGTNISCEENEKDKEIAERLQKLKRDRIKDALPSEEDIAERLAKLKGMDPSKYKAPPIQVYRPPSAKTSVQQATDLMKQIALEVELDSRLVKPEDEIATRLAKLKDQDYEKKKDSQKPSPESDLSHLKIKEQSFEAMDIDQAKSWYDKQCKTASGIASHDVKDLINDPEYKKLLLGIEKEKGIMKESEDDENEANELVEKLLAADIPDVEELDSLNDDTEDTKSEKDTTEEFPWCVICTEDAKIRCFGCDSDLYCMRCFKECHDSLDITDHKTCPYLPPKNPAV